MGKIAFVFSGQGDQYPGMGKELAAAYLEAAKVFDLCERQRPGTIRQCFEGTPEELSCTANTQPCLFAVELAAAAALKMQGVLPDMLAGFSLGEAAALTFAGAFDGAQGFALVTERGRLMQEAAEETNASMAAVLRLSAHEVESLCAELEQVWPVNYNCPGQTVVTAAAQQMEALAGKVRAAGGRLLPLKVGGGFHSPFMRRAGEQFARVLESAEMRQPALPVYSNVDGLPYAGGIQELKRQLARQITSPVLWQQLVANMIADGADTFIEIGPGRTLTGLIRRIDPSVSARTAAEVLAG